MALTTDVVMDMVLSHLKRRDLLSCRLVSKFWNKAASSVLRKRSTMMKTISDENQLMELQECMKKSLDFPFTGLKLDQPWRLNSTRAMMFFQTYGDRFTCLCLDIFWMQRLHAMVPFIDRLSGISILEVGLPYSTPEFAVDCDARQENSKILKLTSVRIFRILSYFSSVSEDILREVLMAASPSLQIECLNLSPDMLRALKRAGKLRSISYMRFPAHAVGIAGGTEMNQLLSTEAPALTRLTFSLDGILSVTILMKILLSSQHTLKELHLENLCLSQFGWEMFPVLAKLTTLHLHGVNFCGRPLFRGEHGNKFPALKVFTLEVINGEDETLGGNLSDGLFIVPSLIKIDLEGYVNEDGMKHLAQAFPNVIEIGLEYEYYSGNSDRIPKWTICGTNPFEIWSVRKFKILEKLTIRGYTIKRPTKKHIAMDSFLTGIPLAISKNLQKQLVSHIVTSPFREAFSEALRVHPSVLQLQKLKELVVCVRHEPGFAQAPQDTPFVSMLSVWYALEMMPNMRAKFLYEDSSPSHFEKPDKAVLEDAFKHVQEYVELEPFYY